MIPSSMVHKTPSPGAPPQAASLGGRRAPVVFCQPVGTQIGSAHFADNVQQMWGAQARREWQSLQAVCRALGADATAIHPMAVRFDNAMLATTALRSPLKLVKSAAAMARLGDRKFGEVVHAHVR